MFGQYRWGETKWGGAAGRFYWLKELAGTLNLAREFAGGLAVKLMASPRRFVFSAGEKITTLIAPARDFLFNTKVRAEDE